MRILKHGIGVVILLGFMMLTRHGSAEEQKKVRSGSSYMESTSITLSVEEIDYKTRKVTLKGPKGGTVTFIVGDEVKNFDQVKKGDNVTFDYATTVAIDVRKATEAPKMVETRSVNRAKLGEKPASTVITEGFLTARVEDIDYKTRIAKLVLPEGQHLTFTVGDQVKRLDEVHKGDEVVVEYQQKLSIKVTTP